MRKVFISYSSKDGDKAALVAGAIEGMGCDCWMAPRDIAPGRNYAEAIVDGLDECAVFLLLLSSDSQASEHVVRELERSVSKGKKIMAVRLEKVSLSKSFEYFLQVTHWIDASESLDAASLAKVANAAVALAGDVRAPEPSSPQPAQGSPRTAGDAARLPSRDRVRGLEGGQTLGDFEILGRLGQGGMGAVYKAQQISLERMVALKTLQGALASDPEYIARFRREAKAAAALNHPNLVQVYAAGENDGLHWFAMEYVEGESAQERLKRKGRLDPAAAIAIGMNVATALEHGWRKAHLIHRDIKPDNIFLSTDGEVKLGDLGLAKSAGENQTLTMSGSSMGTPHYVSPEQAEGKKDVDLRADIYSLGCTLFHLLGGKPPFEGGTALAVMMEHVTAPVPELRNVWPECPEELSRVVMKMMAKQPGDRQQSHEEVIADLRSAYRAFSDAAVPESAASTQTSKASAPEEQQTSAEVYVGDAAEPAIEKTRSSRKPLAVAAVALLAALGALFYFSPWKKSPDPVPRPTTLKIDPAKENSYVGTWLGKGEAAFVIRADHTAIHLKEKADLTDATGTWELKPNGVFEIHIADRRESALPRIYRLSDDGDTLEGIGRGGQLTRVASTQPGAASVPATPAPPPPTPAPVVAPPNLKFDPARAASYVGTWSALNSGTKAGGYDRYVIKDDHTVVRLAGATGSDLKGAWQLAADGAFTVNIGGTVLAFILSQDGETLTATTPPAKWVRVKGPVTVAPVPPPAPTPAPTPTPLPPPTPGSAAYYAGTWRGDARGTSGFILKEDFTGLREYPRDDRGDEKGTWKVDKDGEFEFYNLDGGRWLGKFSADGQSLVHTKSGLIYKRVPAAPKPAKFDPTNPASYVGTWISVWKTRVGEKRISVKADRTAIRTDSDGTKANGTWEVSNGTFRCKWGSEGPFNGTLSDDGQTMESHGVTGAVWTRQKP